MGEHFARGRSAEIFRTEDGKILKLFFPDYPREYAEKEYKNTKIAASLGCTGMQVYDMVERGGRFGFVMDCIDGVSQNDMPGKKPAYLFEAGKDLARCHVRVQKAHTRELDDVREVCLGILGEDCMAFLTQEEKSRAAGYLRSLPDDDTVLHLDFHTGNVLVDKSGECKIIDWMTAARGNRSKNCPLFRHPRLHREELFQGVPEALAAFRGGDRPLPSRGAHPAPSLEHRV